MPFLVILLAGTGQLAALATRRYAPYPAASELPPSGPLRRILRSMLSPVHGRRRARASEGALEALES
jgi:hypothetical protein